jgi:hypothetical protein
MLKTNLPDWEQVLSSAVHLQRILPAAVLVGGTASAIYAKHRMSTDADHVLNNLRQHFDEILATLESVAGWQTALVKRPVEILGNLDGIQTGVRQLIRSAPLETTAVDYEGEKITLPTQEEMLRIKGVLVLKRNATRDYLDFVALADHIGQDRTINALRKLDRLYPQQNMQSALQQLQIQLANPIPYDRDSVRLEEYKHLEKRWHDWHKVKAVCLASSIVIFDQIVGVEIPLIEREKEKQGAWFAALSLAQGKENIVVGESCEKKEFYGAIVGSNQHYVVQDLGRTVAIHGASTLSRIPAVDEFIKIRYDKFGCGIVDTKEMGNKKDGTVR